MLVVMAILRRTLPSLAYSGVVLDVPRAGFCNVLLMLLDKG